MTVTQRSISVIFGQRAERIVVVAAGIGVAQRGEKNQAPEECRNSRKGGAPHFGCRTSRVRFGA
jgi:hypothetical protein